MMFLLFADEDGDHLLNLAQMIEAESSGNQIVMAGGSVYTIPVSVRRLAELIRQSAAGQGPVIIEL